MAKKKTGKKRSAGEGSLYKRADGLWEAKVPVEKDGKSARKSFYGASEKEVKEKRDKYLTEVRTGTYIEPDKRTFGNWTSRYLELFVKPMVKMSTYSKYEINFKTHIEPALGDIELQKVTTEKLQEFYNAKAEKLSSSVVTFLHQIISGALKQAVKQKLILMNPAEFTVRTGVQCKEITPLSRAEVKKYLSAAKVDRLHCLFLLAIATGLRRGELLALKWENIDLNGAVLTVKESLSRVKDYSGKSELVFSEPKTLNSKREIPLLPNVVKELRSHKVRQDKERLKFGEGYQVFDLVFCTHFGTPLEPRNILRTHKDILKKAGLREELTIHSLRHSFGTLLAQSGENPKNLQMLMGHADVRTTLRTYVHTSLEDRKRAIQNLAAIIEP